MACLVQSPVGCHPSCEKGEPSLAAVAALARELDCEHRALAWATTAITLLGHMLRAEFKLLAHDPGCTLASLLGRDCYSVHGFC